MIEEDGVVTPNDWSCPFLGLLLWAERGYHNIWACYLCGRKRLRMWEQWHVGKAKHVEMMSLGQWKIQSCNTRRKAWHP